jgi:hypothetical protein
VIEKETITFDVRLTIENADTRTILLADTDTLSNANGYKVVHGVVTAITPALRVTEACDFSQQIEPSFAWKQKGPL